jgi:hypothetical protein
MPNSYSLCPLSIKVLTCRLYLLRAYEIVMVLAKVQSTSKANYGGLATKVVDIKCLAYSVVKREEGRQQRLTGEQTAREKTNSS